MKPEEAIEILENKKEYSKKITDNFLDHSSVEIKDANETIEMCDIAITALKEVQQYREIGTVEECRKAVEKQKAKKCDVTKDNFRIYYKCPTCNHCLRVEYNHGSWMGKKSKNCSKCGQAISWEESE